MRKPFSLISILSLVIMLCLSCEPQEGEMPDTLKVSLIPDVKRRIPATPVPTFTLNCGSSLRTEDNPAIVLVRDGKESLVSSSLSDINMADVAKISVLKGEAAIEKFGEKVRNGVLVITYK